MKLDRSREFAQTMGDSVARYHQDGHDFDSNGDLIGEIIEQVTQEAAAEAPKRRGRPPKEAAE